MDCGGKSRFRPTTHQPTFVSPQAISPECARLGHSNVQMPVNARFTLRRFVSPLIHSGGPLCVHTQRRVIRRQWGGGLGNDCQAFGHSSVRTRFSARARKTAPGAGALPIQFRSGQKPVAPPCPPAPRSPGPHSGSNFKFREHFHLHPPAFWPNNSPATTRSNNGHEHDLHNIHHHVKETYVYQRPRRPLHRVRRFD